MPQVPAATIKARGASKRREEVNIRIIVAFESQETLK
jgi:hypothetical protein